MEKTLSRLAHSRLFSEELGIQLGTGSDAEVFKWFLASLLFGGRVAASIAKNAYRTFERHQCLTPERIVEVGADYVLNRILRKAGYRRYDRRKSDQIARNCRELISEYSGSLLQLYRAAKTSRDLEKRLMAFYGVGPVTANIFLRELRPYWNKADPHPLPQILKQAGELRWSFLRLPHHSMRFVRTEAGLMRQLNAAGDRRKALSMGITGTIPDGRPLP